MGQTEIRFTDRKLPGSLPELWLIQRSIVRDKLEVLRWKKIKRHHRSRYCCFQEVWCCEECGETVV
jgi:hypothetical protein